MPTKPRTQEIIALFQRYLKTGDNSLIENLSLEELENAEIDLGWRDKNSPWRKAIQHRIELLKQEGLNLITVKKEKTQNKIEQKRHGQSMIIQVVSVLTAIIIALLGWCYLK